MKKIIYFFLLLLFLIPIPTQAQAPPETLKSASKLVKQKKFEEAEAIYLQLQQDFPKDLDVLKGLSRVYLKQKNYSAAITQFEEMLTIDPENPKTYYKLALSHRKLKIMIKPWNTTVLQGINNRTTQIPTTDLQRPTGPWIKNRKPSRLINNT